MNESITKTLNILNASKCFVYEAVKVSPFLYRIETKFKYPDCGSIELFLKQDDKSLRLTDLGETITLLFHHKIDVSKSNDKTSYVIENILKMHNASKDGGEIYMEISESINLVDAIIHLSQACIRISDLLFFSERTI